MPWGRIPTVYDPTDPESSTAQEKKDSPDPIEPAKEPFSISKIPPNPPFEFPDDEKIYQNADGVKCNLLERWEVDTAESHDRLPPEGLQIWKVEYPVTVSRTEAGEIETTEEETTYHGYTTDEGIKTFCIDVLAGEDPRWKVEKIDKLPPKDEIEDSFFQYFGEDYQCRHTTSLLLEEFAAEWDFHEVRWPGQNPSPVYHPSRLVMVHYDPQKEEARKTRVPRIADIVASSQQNERRRNRELRPRTRAFITILANAANRART